MSEPTKPPQALVLLVEDDPHVVKFVEAALTAMDYRVVHAGSGKQALALAAQYVPDLVLLDLGLPDMDGLGVIRGLRPWCKASILVLSARGQERCKVEALDLGADDYLTK